MSARRLKMKYAGGLVKHLGLQMYSGAVGAVAELVANAWDADATEVYVDIPFSSWDQHSAIIVRDNGSGMSFVDCNDEFLLVGRDRRLAKGQYTSKNRLVIGRKGIGKLACFGIARLMEVRTVKDGQLTHFRLDYDEMVGRSGGALISDEPYEPEIVADRVCKEENGTTITLERIELQRPVNEEQFRKSMARRFSILSGNFRVYINDILLQRGEGDFEFRLPPVKSDSLYNDETIPGIGLVRWWIGFTEKPIPDDDARGIVVMVRGKLAQAPFFFNLSGGAAGQHGMQYMTGEILADGLDKHTEVDLIATDRASIRWEAEEATPLLEWGQSKVREWLSWWAEQRGRKRIDQLKREDNLPESYWDRIQRFPPREREEIERAIQIFAQIPTITDERFLELVNLILRAYEDQHFMDLIRALDKLDPDSQSALIELIDEANVLEAVHIASIVQFKVEIIRKFQEMIRAGAPEKKAGTEDMQTILRDNPWLIDPKWSLLRHEKSLDSIVQKYLDSQGVRTKQGRKRVDFFCLADTVRQVVVEVKRPQDTVGATEIQQAMGYVFYLRERANATTDPTRRVFVEGYLIASPIRPEDRQWVETAKEQGVYVRTWENLLDTALELYKDYLDVVKSKAPADDPRLLELKELSGEATA